MVSLTHTRSGSRKTGMNVPAGQAGLTFKRGRGATGKARARRGVFGGCSSVLRALHKANAHDQFLRPAAPVDSKDTLKADALPGRSHQGATFAVATAATITHQ